MPDGIFENLAALTTINNPGGPFAPAANAGDDQVVGLGAAGNPWGSTITYAWIQTGGEDVTLTGKDTATPTFTAPDEAGDLAFELTVTGAPGPEKQPLSPRSILASLRSHLQHFLPRLLPSCRWAAIPPPPVVHFGVGP